MEYEASVYNLPYGIETYVFTVYADHLSEAFSIAISILEDESWWDETKFSVSIELTEKAYDIGDVANIYETLSEATGFFDRKKIMEFTYLHGYYKAMILCNKELTDSARKDYSRALKAFALYNKRS